MITRPENELKMFLHPKQFEDAKAAGYVCEEEDGTFTLTTPYLPRCQVLVTQSVPTSRNKRASDK